MKLASLIRFFTVLSIAISIGVTYYALIVLKDYDILTNPEGPETEDYFEAWHNEK